NRQAAKFQSPLRRGSVFISVSQMLRAMGSRVSIPLRRGSVFIVSVTHGNPATLAVSIPSSSGKCLHRENLWGQDESRPVSIPSSSGKCLHPKVTRIVVKGKDGFNPLFVGEVSSSRRRAASHSSAHQFQSPLRRGSVFILGGPIYVNGKLVVSIPSSSGKCLHRVC